MAYLLSQNTCRRAELLSRTHSSYVVAQILGVSRNTLWHLKKRGWKALLSQKPVRPRPSDFAIQARYMTSDELRLHYQTSTRAVARWKRELRG